jgi:alkylhydroperoxidase family enzyme
MPTIEPISLELADAIAQQLVRAAENRIGQSTNMLHTMAHSQSILETYLHFNRAFEHTKMTTKLRGLLTIAIAQAMGCEYILSVALALGVREGLSLEELEAGRHTQSEDPKIAAALNFAVRAIEEQAKIDPPSVATLRRAGYTDEEIVEIIGAIALNLFRNFFNLIAGTEVDFPQTSDRMQGDLVSSSIEPGQSKNQ